jgi:hypothetical protein
VDSRDPRDDLARKRFDDISRDLNSGGLTVLGDLMELRDDSRVAGVVRWFRNETGTTCGWFGLAGGTTAVMIMFSESAHGDFLQTTRGAANRSLARPPNVDYTWLAWEEGAGNQLRRHNARIAERGGGSEWRRVTSTDDAVQVLRRLRANGVKWRAAQPEAELLEKDLQALFKGTSIKGSFFPAARGVRRALAKRAGTATQR